MGIKLFHVVGIALLVPRFLGAAEVAVIMPAYNAAATIAAAVHSVQTQSFADWQLYVVDDDSTDATTDIVAGLAAGDPRITLMQLPKHTGRAGIVRNHPLRLVQERYVAFLDSDDLWLPEKLERQLAFMAAHDVAFSFTSFRALSADGNEVSAVQKAPPVISYNALLGDNPIGMSTVVIDRQLTGVFEFRNVVHGADLVLWLDLVLRGVKAGGLADDLMRYRLSRRGLSRNKLKMALARWHIYRRIQHLQVAPAAFYLAKYALDSSLKHWRRRQSMSAANLCAAGFITPGPL